MPTRVVAFLIAGAVASGAGAVAGEVPAPAADATPGPRRTVDVGVAYYGELLTHPGVKMGASVPLLGGRGWNLLFAGVNLGYYWHPGNSDNLFANAELGYRLTFPFRLYVEVAVAAGSMLTFADGPVYEVEAGKVRRATDTGVATFMPGASLGLGFDLGRGRAPRWPVKVYLKQLAFGQVPVDHVMVLNVGVEVGALLTLPLDAAGGGS